jgi:hypothetical protein
MIKPKILPSNEFWGFRSGAITAAQGRVFQQQQFGSGNSRSNRPKITKLVNVNHSWFKKVGD